VRGSIHAVSRSLSRRACAASTPLMIISQYGLRRFGELNWH
jgi:hypothetical protein